LRSCLKYARRWAELRAQAMAAGIERNDPASSRNDTYPLAEAFGKPADVARARDVALAATGKAYSVAAAVEALSVLGFTDDAFTVAQRFTPAGIGILHSFSLPSRRRCGRIRASCKWRRALGWSITGTAAAHWPDFCAEPGLPTTAKRKQIG